MQYNQTKWVVAETTRVPVTVSFYNDLLYADAERTCKKIGHKWVDTSSGGPEGGNVSGYCERCCYSHSVILY